MVILRVFQMFGDLLAENITGEILIIKVLTKQKIKNEKKIFLNYWRTETYKKLLKLKKNGCGGG